MNDKYETDFEDIKRRVQEDDEKRVADFKKQRKPLHKKLKALGVLTISAEYEGRKDESEVSTMGIKPHVIKLTPELDSELEDFILLAVGANIPDFHREEGSYGDLKWDIGKDKIKLSHVEKTIEYTDYELDDL